MQYIITNVVDMCYDDLARIYFKSTREDLVKTVTRINNRLINDWRSMVYHDPEDILQWISEELYPGAKTGFYYKVIDPRIIGYMVDCEVFACLKDDVPCYVVRWVLYHDGRD